MKQLKFRYLKWNIAMFFLWLILWLIIMMQEEKFAPEMMPVVISCIIFNLFCSLFPVAVQLSLPVLILRVSGLFRYVLLPMVMQKEGILVESRYKEGILIIMILELVGEYLGIFWFVLKKTVGNNPERRKGSKESFPNQKIGLSVIMILCLGCFFVMQNRTYLERYFLISSHKEIRASSFGGIGLMVSCFFLLVFILALDFLKNMPIKENWVKVILSLGLSLFYINGSSITGENVSRWTILITALVIFQYISKIYPSYKKYLLVLLGVVAAFAITFGTVMKLGDKNSNYATLNKAMETQFSYRSLNAYFAGTQNMEVAWILQDNVEQKRISTVEIIQSDFFANFPLLNRYLSNPRRQATAMFNLVYYGSDIAQDQIIPFAQQMYLYFRWLFFLANFVLTYYALKCYWMIQTENDFLKIYCLTYLFFSFSLVNCVSFSVILQNLWIHVLPVFLICLFNVRGQVKNMSYVLIKEKKNGFK